jgi:hypothetical protein
MECRREGGGGGLPGSTFFSPDPNTTYGSWYSSSSSDAPPGLPKATNYNYPTICIMLMPLPLFVSKILLITFLSHEAHLHYRAALWLVCNGRMRGRDLGHFFLGKKLSFSQATCYGQVRSPVCSLLASRRTENGFFSCATPTQKKRTKNM